MATTNSIQDIIHEAFVMGGLEVIRILRPKDDEISQRKAFDEFGKGFVTRLTEEGIVDVIRKGTGQNSKKVYSRAQIRRAMAERNITRDIIEIESFHYNKD